MWRLSIYNMAINRVCSCLYQSSDELKLIYQTINMNYKRVVGLNLYAPPSM